MNKIEINVPPYKSCKITIETKQGDLETKYTKEFENRCQCCRFIEWTKLSKMNCKRNFDCDFQLHDIYAKELLSQIPLRLNHLTED